jgi:hypothetical protein
MTPFHSNHTGPGGGSVKHGTPARGIFGRPPPHQHEHGPAGVPESPTGPRGGRVSRPAGLSPGRVRGHYRRYGRAPSDPGAVLAVEAWSRLRRVLSLSRPRPRSRPARRDEPVRTEHRRDHHRPRRRPVGAGHERDRAPARPAVRPRPRPRGRGLDRRAGPAPRRTCGPTPTRSWSRTGRRPSSSGRRPRRCWPRNGADGARRSRCDPDAARERAQRRPGPSPRRIDPNF